MMENFHRPPPNQSASSATRYLPVISRQNVSLNILTRTLSNVTVTDSLFNVADDGVCIKSSPGMQSTSNVVVRRSRVRSRSSAIKFGSTTPVDIHDLLFDDIVIWDSNAGLSIQVKAQPLPHPTSQTMVACRS
jgi:hypothetical protein